MSLVSSPRVNGRLLGKYEGRQVNLVGRVLQSTDQFTILEASDHQQVRVISTGKLPLPQQSIVEIVGIVNRDHSVMETSRTSYSDNFNLDVYEEFLKQAQDSEIKSLFGF